MNARQTIRKLCRTTALLVVLPLAAGNAAAAVYSLVAMPFDKAMPDGSSVRMWGYAIDDGVSLPSVPGPALVVLAGDTTLTVNLRNTLPEPSSVVISGQAMPTGLAPVKFTDSSGRQRARSFTAEAAAAGGTQSYTWNNLKPGTYLYHSGTHPQVQVQMGLYGAVTHDAVAAVAGTSPAEAYAGVPYHSEVTLLFSEVDPALHTAVATGQYGPGTAMSSTIDYAPKYFLINGVAHPDANLTFPNAGSAGQTTLLRLLNAGLQSRSPVLQGMHMRLVAEDGNSYPHAREQYATLLPALKTVDAVITPTEAATYPIYDRRLAMTNPGAGGSTAGGMLAFLTVADAAAGTPVAANDAYAASEDTPLAVVAPGVLGNDDAGTTAQWLSGPSHGSVSLAADGSFTYTPALNYNGTDSFSYQALSGGVASLPATVSLTVSPANDPPSAANDAYSVAAGATLNVAAPGVLGNDSDVDGDALSAVNPSGGLALNANGSFSYTAGAAGIYNFTYQAQDPSLATSAPATITITVTANQAPVAVKDTFNVARNSTGNILNVATNDTDADGNLVPGTVEIVVAPNKGGTATENGDGTVTYAPRLNFRGTENFSYRVQDSGELWSNTVVVRVNVK